MRTITGLSSAASRFHFRYRCRYALLLALGQHLLHQPAQLVHADLALRGLQQLPLHVQRHRVGPLRRQPGRP